MGLWFRGRSARFEPETEITHSKAGHDDWLRQAQSQGWEIDEKCRDRTILRKDVFDLGLWRFYTLATFGLALPLLFLQRPRVRHWLEIDHGQLRFDTIANTERMTGGLDRLGVAMFSWACSKGMMFHEDDRDKGIRWHTWIWRHVRFDWSARSDQRSQHRQSPEQVFWQDVVRMASRNAEIVSFVAAAGLGVAAGAVPSLTLGIAGGLCALAGFALGRISTKNAWRSGRGYRRDSRFEWPKRPSCNPNQSG